MQDHCRVGQSHVNDMKYEYKLKLSQRQNWLLKYENQIKTYEVKDVVFIWQQPYYIKIYCRCWICGLSLDINNELREEAEMNLSEWRMRIHNIEFKECVA